MDIEAQTLKNTQDIGTLLGSVAELATMIKYETERMKDDRAGIKDMITELRGLNDKITGMASVQKDMAQADKDITELRTRVDSLKEWKDKYDIGSINGRVVALEATKERETGERRALSTGAEWFWRIFGNAITAAVVGAIVWSAMHLPDFTKQTSYTEHTIHGTITGE